MHIFLKTAQRIQKEFDRFEVMVRDSWRIGDAKFEPKSMVLPAPWDSLRGI